MLTLSSADGGRLRQRARVLNCPDGGHCKIGFSKAPSFYIAVGVRTHMHNFKAERSARHALDKVHLWPQSLDQASRTRELSRLLCLLSRVRTPVRVAMRPQTRHVSVRIALMLLALGASNAFTPPARSFFSTLEVSRQTAESVSSPRLGPSGLNPVLLMPGAVSPQ